MPPVRHRWDASTVIGMLAVLFGMAWLLSATHLLHASLEGVVALGLMLLGAALVITGRTDWSLSRHSWPVWLGAVMIIVLVSTSSTLGLGGAAKNVSFGNKSEPASAGTTVHGGFGNLTVNMPTNAKGTYDVVSVAGQTYIYVPADEPVTVNARVVGGQICVDGSNVANGVAAQYHGTANPAPGVTPSATLDVHQVFGQIVIGPVDGGCHK